LSSGARVQEQYPTQAKIPVVGDSWRDGRLAPKALGRRYAVTRPPNTAELNSFVNPDDTRFNLGDDANDEFTDSFLKRNRVNETKDRCNAIS
jgi:hypothetical protein